jgi:hypothetical protein
MKTSIRFVAMAIRACWDLRDKFPVSKRPKVGSWKKAEAAIEHFNSLTPDQRGRFLVAAFLLADFVEHITDELDEVDVNVVEK